MPRVFAVDGSWAEEGRSGCWVPWKRAVAERKGVSFLSLLVFQQAEGGGGRRKRRENKSSIVFVSAKNVTTYRRKRRGRSRSSSSSRTDARLEARAVGLGSAAAREAATAPALLR